MGHLHSRANTFWQVFFRPPNSARWTLVTPPGVASNGGLSADGAPGTGAGPGTVTAGFEPSEDLRYSPIARTIDDGKKWTAGVLPAGLLPVADAVADGAAGVTYALVRSDGGALVGSDGSLTSWSAVVTRRALGATSAGRACGTGALTAVADPGGRSPELGAACTSPGVVGLFHRSAGRWVATTLRGRLDARSTYRVLRLAAGAAGTSALVEAQRGDSASLVALWRAGPSAGWSASSPVRLHGAVLSTASDGATSLLVVTGRGTSARDLLWVGGPGTPWRSLGPPPAGTQAVASAPGVGSTGGADVPGAVVALSVSGSDLTVWERGAEGRWTRTGQRLRVPVEYGSST
jgi:hypothetical protein